ncbi:hypothetical protein EOW65_18670 [Sinirhodobacter ferrireducens]|uniref:Pilus assembly protein n=1 Tax=Paenirhodobacter ferrireducens TaxID=1215032 RepID=A0A443L5J9_9RHOB|nr:hypothetical protein [Sinirhodobacter ferrireducens]RWR44446.1 hypothetical protein EOW65_18670 [Sinirhodobacter ferrireducens]
MKFFKIARKIRTEEDGAVTVDWVVLTAAVVGLGAAALATISTNTKKAAGNIGSYLGSVDVTTTTPAVDG